MEGRGISKLSITRERVKTSKKEKTFFPSKGMRQVFVLTGKL